MIQLALIEMGVSPAVAFWLALAIGAGLATVIIAVIGSTASERNLETERMDIWEPAKEYDGSDIVPPLTDDEIKRLRKLLAAQDESPTKEQQ